MKFHEKFGDNYEYIDWMAVQVIRELPHYLSDTEERWPLTGAFLESFGEYLAAKYPDGWPDSSLPFTYTA